MSEASLSKGCVSMCVQNCPLIISLGSITRRDRWKVNHLDPTSRLREEGEKVGGGGGVTRQKESAQGK